MMSLLVDTLGFYVLIGIFFSLVLAYKYFSTTPHKRTDPLFFWGMFCLVIFTWLGFLGLFLYDEYLLPWLKRRGPKAPK